MCGFAGVISWDDRYRVSRDILARMSGRVAHRGPDGEGLWISEDAAKPQAALAHRRLAIIDPDPRANQPFSDQHGRQLVYNGEIYNFRALRAELSALLPHYAWRTQCDTEVLLVAYDVWGEKCVRHFDGMFAFAIWDQANDLVFLARDRMGQKPLYVSTVPSADGGCGAVAFASELSALRELPWFDSATDAKALGHYLRWGYIPAPMTIYRGAEKLPPARWMRIRPREIVVEAYFSAHQASSKTSGEPSGDPVATTRSLLTQAVSRQLVSDVPVGCFLSGGIDSSIVASAMKRALGNDQPMLTFSIGFDDHRYDETKFAAEVARRLGTKHQQFTVRPNAAEDLPKLAAVFGEPFADSSALPTHYLARETRQHVKVALSGDGGDELFGGYDRYRAMWLGESFRELPARLRAIAMNKLWQRVPGAHPKSHVTRAKRLLASLALEPAQRYDSYMRFFDDDLLQQITRDTSVHEGREWLIRQFYLLVEGRDVVRASMALDRVTYLPEDLLTKVDRASMLHSLEVRSPFMDSDLVRFAAGLATAQLFGTRAGGLSFMENLMTTGGKRLLREAFAGDLPASVFKRRKMGFAVPIGDWFCGELRSLLRDSLTARDSFAAQHFDPNTITRLIDEHESARADHSQRLYALLMLELWHQSCAHPHS